MQRLRYSLVLAIAGISLSCGGATAQDYPSKTVRFIVPLSPGGGTDIAARLTAQKLTERWSQQFVVENRPGGGAVIGAELVARAAPDGYTLLVTSPGAVVVNPWLFRKLPYEPRDFVPVVMLAPTYYVLIAHPSVPAKSVSELIQVARKHPGGLVLASGGLAAPSDLIGEMFKNLARIDAITVQYKGGGHAIADLISGQASMMFADMIAAMPYVAPRRVKLLAVLTAQRVPQLPDTPTLKESGIDYDALGWSGVFAPARTPAAIVTKLNSELRNILRLPDIQTRLASDGSAFGPNTPESLQAFIRSEFAKYETAIKISGRRLD